MTTSTRTSFGETRHAPAHALMLTEVEQKPIARTYVGPPMVHLVMHEWPGGPWSETALCGARKATREPAAGHVVDCVVCIEMATARGWKP